jgi:hypothetical protein
MTIRGVEINTVATKMVKYTKIYFKASDGWIWQFSKKCSITDRHKFGEALSGPSERV